MAINPDPNHHVPPDWARGQAMNDLEDEDTEGRDQRAWDLVRKYEEERHGADDDPDQGGEA